ncbi:cytochrome P450 2A5-like [Pelobates cultripes]|uniref:Cytochrome P450 2A5-like n=2 Tax=Pelobates cultripes TaxID=61616 RepID=A0AAD1TK02_PELCU|nr:cytochrome P450 2A5-like [Pelobates cultripes]
MDTFTLALSLFILISLLFSTLKMYKKRLCLPPGPTPLPLVGNLLQGSTILYDTYGKFTEQYGPIFTVWNGTSPAVALCGYDVLKEALVNYAKLFSYRGSIPISERLMNGCGIVTTNGELWQQTRRFAVASLRNSGLGTRTIDQRIQEEASHLIQAVKDINGQAFNPQTLLGRAVNNVINLTMFGKRWDYKDKQFLSFLKIIDNLFLFLRSPLGVIYASFPMLMKYLPGPHQKKFHDTEAVKSLIKEQIVSHMETLDVESPRDFIDCFLIQMKKVNLLQGNVFSIENLMLTMFELFIVGTETTANTLYFSLLVMIKYPQIQDRIQQEIDIVIGTDRLPKLADRIEMPYTNAVMHEIMRFVDIVPMGLPHQIMEDITFRGFNIPKGTTIIPMLASALSDPAHWEKPDEFYPGHFLDKNGQFCINDAFIPFSAGKRICPGEAFARTEIFLFVTSLLQNFTLRAVNHPDTFNLNTLRRTFRKQGLLYNLKAFPRGRANERCSGESNVTKKEV